MYAFKTERPDAARRYHNKFVTGTNYQEESNRRFALSEPFFVTGVEILFA